MPAGPVSARLALHGANLSLSEGPLTGVVRELLALGYVVQAGEWPAVAITETGLVVQRRLALERSEARPA